MTIMKHTVSNTFQDDALPHGKVGLGRLPSIINNYVVDRLLNKPSTAGFWYLDEPANVYDEATLRTYNAPRRAVPQYLIDYRQKLAFELFDDNGILILPYSNPIGEQINPEAAFQYALGLSDRFLETSESIYLDKFLHFATYFLEDQSDQGHWWYRFPWFDLRSPWYSALAQSRGASVMLRAWLYTNDEKYLVSAKKAISLFGRSVIDGGYLCEFAPEGCTYYEEHPGSCRAVLNGFVAALFGLYELKHWSECPEAECLWDEGVKSLMAMLPHYTTQWWTLYSLDPLSPVKNVHSPRYHRMMIEYMRVINTLHPSDIFVAFLNKWVVMDTRINRTRAYAMKLVHKVLYR